MLNNIHPINLRFKLAMKENNGCQQKLAILLGVSVATINTWVHGRRPIKAKYIVPICDELGISVLWLLKGNGDTDKERNGYTNEECLYIDLLRRQDRVTRGSVMNILTKMDQSILYISENIHD